MRTRHEMSRVDVRERAATMSFTSCRRTATRSPAGCKELSLLQLARVIENHASAYMRGTRMKRDGRSERETGSLDRGGNFRIPVRTSTEKYRERGENVLRTQVVLDAC